MKKKIMNQEMKDKISHVLSKNKRNSCQVLTYNIFPKRDFVLDTFLKNKTESKEYTFTNA